MPVKSSCSIPTTPSRIRRSGWARQLKQRSVWPWHWTRYAALVPKRMARLCITPTPLRAILDTVRHQHFDEVIVSTLPAGISRWLRLDLVHRIDRKVDAPVTHIVAADFHGA
jgi:hypothetical protein